jgi:hypothetical protein
MNKLKAAKSLVKFAKYSALGGVAGYASARIVSSSNDAREAGHSGVVIGALIGGVAGSRRLLAKSGVKAAKVFSAGLQSRGGKLGAAVGSADRAARTGKVIFRRMGGRIRRFLVK